MKLLLTSAGISNVSIQNALVELLGKPISESSALFVPTAIYGIAGGGDIVRKVICGVLGDPFCDLGWRSLGLLELTALPTMKQELWVPILHQTDALLVGGGDCQYLTYWMQQSGLADLLPSLGEKVWVGLSAGSMVMTPRIGQTFVEWKSPDGGDKTLGIVDFSIFPHLNNPDLPQNTLTNAEKWAAEVQVPAYAIDDETAIKVVDGTVEVISEGHWKLLKSS